MPGFSLLLTQRVPLTASWFAPNLFKPGHLIIGECYKVGGNAMMTGLDSAWRPGGISEDIASHFCFETGERLGNPHEFSTPPAAGTADRSVDYSAL